MLLIEINLLTIKSIGVGSSLHKNWVSLLLYKNAGFSEILSDKYELFLDNNSLLELINKIKKNKNFNYFENKLNLNKLFFDEFNQYK